LKTSNWLAIANLSECEEYNEHGFIAQVIYTTSDLILPMSQQLILEVETVIVALSDNKHASFIGVAQTSPRDQFNRNIGREIAAGRAMKAFLQTEKTGILNLEYYMYKVPNKDEEGILIGKIPTTVIIQEIVDALRQP
jgi:hypothetical protein